MQQICGFFWIKQLFVAQANDLGQRMVVAATPHFHPWQSGLFEGISRNLGGVGGRNPLLNFFFGEREEGAYRAGIFLRSDPPGR